VAVDVERLDAVQAESRYKSAPEYIEKDLKQTGGFVTRRDLMAVRAREQTPLRTIYRDAEVVSFPSPGSGGLVLYALNLLEQYPTEKLHENTADRLQVLRQGRLINCGGVSAAYYDAATGLMTAVGDPRRSGRAAGAGF
jgi:gamma-glutamyltranspeptidase